MKMARLWKFRLQSLLMATAFICSGFFILRQTLFAPHVEKSSWLKDHQFNKELTRIEKQALHNIKAELNHTTSDFKEGVGIQAPKLTPSKTNFTLSNIKFSTEINVGGHVPQDVRLTILGNNTRIDLKYDKQIIDADHKEVKQKVKNDADNLIKNNKTNNASDVHNIEVKTKQTTPSKSILRNKDIKTMPNSLHDIVTNRTANTDKYLIYLCDNKTYCYGFGDRQRGIVSLYHLAELTGRRFGIIMTSPVNIREFYEPNLINWDIHPSDLPTNATTHEITIYGNLYGFYLLEKHDFNTIYPQDVVYIRTNQVSWFITRRNPMYRSKTPKWAKTHHTRYIGIGWLRLMKPTKVLRTSLNEMLVNIVSKIQEESEIWNAMNKTNCCQRTIIPKIRPNKCDQLNTAFACTQNMSSYECCEKHRMTNFVGCLNLRSHCLEVQTANCEKVLTSKFKTRLHHERTKWLAENFCSTAPSVSKWNGTLQEIKNKKGYDLTHMNLVCAHIRLGKSKTKSFTFDSVFNTMDSLTGVWKFLQSFHSKGYHIYLASDAQQVKDEAAALFGDRLHTGHDEIVHIGSSHNNTEDNKNGMLFALTEQLLMATACEHLVMSHSGFSGRAVEIRRELMGGDTRNVYKFEKGVVTKIA